MSAERTVGGEIGDRLREIWDKKQAIQARRVRHVYQKDLARRANSQKVSRIRCTNYTETLAALFSQSTGFQERKQRFIQ
jgi:hypothetical protein